MRQIRILMASMPRLLRQILESAVGSQPDVTVMGEVMPSESVAAAAKRVRAGIVILGESRGEPDGTPWDVLNEDPRLKLLVVSSDGHRATRYELRPHQTMIDDISPEGLIDVVRAAMTGEE